MINKGGSVFILREKLQGWPVAAACYDLPALCAAAAAASGCV